MAGHTVKRGRSSGVEHYLAKVRVVSSNLIARSTGSKALKYLYFPSITSRNTRGELFPARNSTHFAKTKNRWLDATLP